MTISTYVSLQLCITLLLLFLSYRQGETSDSEVVGRICHMLCVLDKYAQFEYVLLRDSDRFFETEGAQLVNVYDTARFLSLVDRRLQVSILVF